MWKDAHLWLSAEIKAFKTVWVSFLQAAGHVPAAGDVCAVLAVCAVLSSTVPVPPEQSFSSAGRGLEPSSDASLALGLGLTVFADRVKHSIHFSAPKDLFPAALRHSESLYLSDWR